MTWKLYNIDIIQLIYNGYLKLLAVSLQDLGKLTYYLLLNINSVSPLFNKNDDQIIRATLHVVTNDRLQQCGLVGS
jgi:hypothetical protein